MSSLGSEVHTAVEVLRLPAEKLAHLWVTLMLMGTLQHACRVIKPGRSFLCQMIGLLHIPRCPHQHVLLNKHFRSDLQRWRVLAFKVPGICTATSSNWNQASMKAASVWSAPGRTLANLITPPILRQIQAVCWLHLLTIDKAMLWATALALYFGFV